MNFINAHMLSTDGALTNAIPKISRTVPKNPEICGGAA